MKNTDTLKKNYEFRYVLTKGKGVFGNYLSLYYMQTYAKKNRIGIAVGKKVAKAVKRNQIKRWIRESYIPLEERLQGYYQIVFVLKKNVSIEELNFWKIKKESEELFKKAGMI